MALANPELTPREPAWEIINGHGTFISETGVYRILRDYDLVTGPAYIVLSSSDEFKHRIREFIIISVCTSRWTTSRQLMYTTFTLIVLGRTKSDYFEILNIVI